MPEIKNPRRMECKRPQGMENWLTRQQVCTQLGITGYRFNKYLAALGQEGLVFVNQRGEIVSADETPGTTGLVSPELFKLLQDYKQEKDSERADASWLNATEAQEYIGCGTQSFYDLITNYPPQEQNNDSVVMGTQERGQEVRHYHRGYIERLKKIWERGEFIPQREKGARRPEPAQTPELISIDPSTRESFSIKLKDIFTRINTLILNRSKTGSEVAALKREVVLLRGRLEHAQLELTSTLIPVNLEREIEDLLSEIEDFEEEYKELG